MPSGKTDASATDVTTGRGGIVQKMQTCPSCGHHLQLPEEKTQETFSCATCESALQARLRYEAFFMGVCTATAVFVSAVTLVGNPKFRPSKCAALAGAMQSGLARLLWSTPFVRISLQRVAVWPLGVASRLVGKWATINSR